MVLSLAVGIGANVSLFAVIRAVAYPRLPYRSPDRIVVLHEVERGTGDPIRYGLTFDEFKVWKAEAEEFEALSLVQYRKRFGLVGFGRPQVVGGRKVSGDFFKVLGVSPAQGRLFSTEDEGRAAAVLSFGAWSTLMGARPEAIGAIIEVDGDPVEIVGVASRDFHFLFEDSDLWLLASEHDLKSVNHQQLLLGRLKKGLDPSKAQQRLNSMHAFFRPEHDYVPGIELEGLLEFYRRSGIAAEDLPTRLFLAQLLMFVVLLLAATNVASLLSTRTLTRIDELSLRVVLGATRRRVAAILAAEGIVVSLLGGAGGVMLALVLLTTLSKWVPQALPGAVPELAWADLLTAFFLSLAVGAVLSLLVTWLSSKLPSTLRLQQAMKLFRGPSGSLAIRGILLLQVVLAATLLTGAGILGNSFVRLLAVDKGFDPENLLLAELRLPESRYVVEDQASGKRTISQGQANFLERVLEQLSTHPQIEVSGAANDIMNQGVIIYTVEGQPAEGPIPTVMLFRAVTPGYFAAMRMPVVKGRLFESLDGRSGEQTAIISRNASRLLWPNERPVGRLILEWKDQQPPIRIVGVVSDTRQAALDKQPTGTVYIPYRQLPFDYDSPGRLRLNVTLAVRFRGSVEAASEAVRAAIRSGDPELPVYSLQTARQLFRDQLAERTFLLAVLLALTFVAVTLVCIGIVGMTSSLLRRRRREIGVRIAIGASRKDVMALLLGTPFRVAALGVGIGGWSGYLLATLLGRLLFRVEPFDPLTYAVTSLLLILITALSAYWTARPARRLDAGSLLRAE